MDTHDLKTALELKSGNSFETLVIEKLEKARIKSVSRISVTDEIHPRKGLRYNKKGPALFGIPLICKDQPKSPFTLDNTTVSLPKVFVKTVNFLIRHVDSEGIFRKAGSINRQKLLRDNNLSPLPDSTSPHDVAAILKQYLRELPEPLLTNRLYPVFTEIATSYCISDAEKQDLILSTSFLLPEEHLLCLKILMQLLHKVAECSANSLMDSNSLALVMSPNILPPSTVLSDVKSNTDIAKVLIEQASSICRVPVDPSTSVTTKQPLNACNSHTPWREYVSDKIRGTWTRLKGRSRLRSDEDLTGTTSKISALDESVSELEINQTPSSLFGTAKRLKKHKPKRRIKPGPIPFNIPLTTPAGSKPHPSILSVPFTDISKVPVTDEHDPLATPVTTAVDSDNNHTIGQRVRKRRQCQRDIVQSSSIEFASLKKPVKPNDGIMTVSHSDHDLVNTKCMTPAATTSSNKRPRLKAAFSARSEKRKGFVHEPGPVTGTHSTSSVGAGVTCSTSSVTRSTSGVGAGVTHRTSGVRAYVTRSTSGVGAGVTRSTSGVGAGVTHSTSGVGAGVTRSTSGVGAGVTRSTSGVGAGVTRSTSGVGAGVTRSTSGVTHSTSGVGAGVTRSTSRAHKNRRIKYKYDDEAHRLLLSADEENSENSFDNKENIDVTKLLVKDSTNTKQPCGPESPGLLGKISSEISERYQYSPYQLAPMLKNDSYLFAMNTSNDSSMCLKRGAGGGIRIPSPCEEVIGGYESDNPSTTVRVENHKDSRKDKHVLRSKSFFNTPLSKTNHRSSATAEKQKLSRRARQYVIMPTYHSTTNKTTPSHRYTKRQQQQCDKTTTVNKRGITVYEWIL